MIQISIPETIPLSTYQIEVALTDNNQDPKTQKYMFTLYINEKFDQDQTVQEDVEAEKIADNFN